MNRLEKALRSERSVEEQWIYRLREEYPEGDIGLFSFFVLALTRIEPGQAVFVDVPEANETNYFIFYHL